MWFSSPDRLQPRTLMEPGMQRRMAAGGGGAAGTLSRLAGGPHGGLQGSTGPCFTILEGVSVIYPSFPHLPILCLPVH